MERKVEAIVEQEGESWVVKVFIGGRYSPPPARYEKKEDANAYASYINVFGILNYADIADYFR